MESVAGIPAAQYVRMSTENQQYSIANQKDAIEEYASNHEYVIVTTYADEGMTCSPLSERI
jgi:DNA invertase Pin-like site-specific DNA recombinase